MKRSTPRWTRRTKRCERGGVSVQDTGAVAHVCLPHRGSSRRIGRQASPMADDDRLPACCGVCGGWWSHTAARVSRT